MKMLNSIVPSVNPWVTPTGTGLQLDITIDNPQSPTVQPVFNLLQHPLIYPMLHEFVNEDVMGRSVENLVKNKCKILLLSPLNHQENHHITEGYQVGQS